ncbi:imelysin family protein [Pseudooceanicola sp. LIPI14-2-Ac024]|uniref:imelysin family protein n=1 Tax=Pseudooceanicola sp. LIPI14-2-Ac024 TaxID=3344875 RepID=UPI0035CEDF60
MKRALALCLCLATPLHAGVPEVVNDHVLPGTAAFADATRALADTARQDCTTTAVQPAFHDAFDAWLGISHLAFGPVEDDGRGLAIAFWPDTRGLGNAAVAQLVANEDAAVDDPAEFAEVSVAARGFFALEQLLYDEKYAGYAADSYTCRLVAATAADLSRMADEIDAAWRGTQAPLMLSAGEAGNPRYFSEQEAQQQLYTALQAALEFDADARLKRPLGSFDRPRPLRAEARRSGRSLRNVTLSLQALEDLSEALADAPIPQTHAAFATALEVAADLDDPVFAGVAEPGSRLKVEILQQRIDAIAATVAGEIGAQLGVTEGFNSADGD